MKALTMVLLSLMITGCTTNAQRIQDMQAQQVGYELPNTQSRLFYEACLELTGTDKLTQLHCFESALRRDQKVGL